MSKLRDDKGRFLKQNPPKTNTTSVGAGTSITESTTPTAGKITLEELEEKQRSRQRLTLVERQVLLAYKVKKKQTQTELSSVGKQKEKQTILEEIEQPLFPTEISDFTTENFFEMTEADRQERERMERELARKRNEERERKEREDRESHREEARGNEEEEEEEHTTFAFPIVDTPTLLGDDIKMKNIPPSVLPNFFGLTTEDPDSFMFEFDIVCRTYGYTSDAQKLCLFPATLKGYALKWFMGLGEATIVYWEDMKKKFITKYQPYCKSKDSKEDIFKMTQSEEESLEEYLEKFLYNMHKSKQANLPLDVIRTIFLKGISDDNLEALNLMGAGDISHLPFPKIAELCKKYSRGKTKRGIGQRDNVTRSTKSISNGVTKTELGNMFESFKTDIMSTFGTQLDMLKAKQKREEQEKIFSIWCPSCRKKHGKGECPLNKVQVCGLCTDNHATDDCPRLKELQATHIEEGQGMESLYYLAPRRPWQPCFTGMSQNFTPQQFPQNFQNPIQNSWNAPMPWQAWPP
jgi:hypothetical protein